MPPAESHRSTRDGSKRNSIRQSLNFMTVGKTLADVINTDKDSKTLKRSNTMSTKPSAPRPSLGDPPSTKRNGSPDSGTSTHRRRMSAIPARTRQSLDDFGVKESAEPVATITRSSTLRARPGTAGSALPKYRPKPGMQGHSKKTSPVKAGTRRRLGCSDDEKEGEQFQSSQEDKAARPISPLPQRATRKPHGSRTTGTPTPDLVRASPRLTKAQKPSPHSSGSSSGPRPDSSASCSSTPPSTPSKKRITQSKDPQPKSTHGSPLRASDSPVSKKARRTVPNPAMSPAGGKMSRIFEGASEEVDKADVAFLLAPNSSFSGPTPAMPRVIPSNNRENSTPQTPSRGSKRSGPSKAPVIVPLPTDDSPRRPLKSSTSNAPRESLLSWEEMAQEASRTLGEGEVGALLAEVDAPFRSSAGSPSLTYAGLPDSPALSHLGSPPYKPLTSVLLPDVTPSPAPHAHRSQQLDEAIATSVDSAQLTLLKLQLASMEKTANDRLGRIQSLEKELSNLKKVQLRETEQLTSQVSQLEQQIRGKLQASQRVDEEHMIQIAKLQEQVQHAQAAQHKAVSHAVEQTKQQCHASQTRTLALVGVSWKKLYLSQAAATSWSTSQSACIRELELLKSDRQLIEVLLPELELLRSQLVSELSSCK